MEKQKHYKLGEGGIFLKDNGGDHSVVVKGINYY
jgi:hypothetical protein